MTGADTEARPRILILRATGGSEGAAAGAFDPLVSEPDRPMKTPSLPFFAALIVSQSASAQTNLYKLQGTSSDQSFGKVMALAGDLNGDTIEDFFVGIPCGAGATACTGRVRACSGRDGSTIWEASSLLGGPELGLGERVSGLSDVTGDGVPDLVTVVRGDAGGLTAQTVQIRSGADGSVVAAELFHTGEEPNQTASSRLSEVGDVNGDSVSDFIVGIPEASQGIVSGGFEIRSGVDASLIRAVDATSGMFEFGYSVAGVGDVTGDGVGDYAAGVPLPSPFNEGPGELRVYSGATGDLAYTAVGTSAKFGLGESVTSIGDIDGDGVRDLVAGGQGTIDLSFPGGIQVISGATGTTLFSTEGIHGENLGSTVCPAGDYNGDGTPDFATRSASELGSGRVIIYSGADFSRIVTFDGGMSGTGDFGYGLQGGADLNGDGFPNLLVADLEFTFEGSVTLFGRATPNGGTLCKGLPNSTGQRAVLTASSPSNFSAAANDLTLTAIQLPQNSMGYFIVSSSFNVLPNPGGSAGRMCVASLQIGRYSGSPLNSGATGTVNFSVDTTMIPIVTGGGPTLQMATAGSTYNFQLWYRHDNGTGGATSNFSDAVTVRFN